MHFGLPYKAGANNVPFSRAETSATNPTRVCLFRLKIGPLNPQTISGTLDLVWAALESAADANMYWSLHAYVSEGESDVVRGTILNQYSEDTTNEWPTTAAGTALQAPVTLTDVDAEFGDWLIVEGGYAARNSTSSSRTGTTRIGSVGHVAVLGELPDLGVGDTDVDLKSGFLVFSQPLDIYEPEILDGDLVACNLDLYHYDGTTGDLKQIRLVARYHEPAGGAQGPDGTLFLAGESSDSILKFDTDLSFIEALDVSPGVTPHALAFNLAGEVWVGYAGDGDTSACGNEGVDAGSAPSIAVRSFQQDGTPVDVVNVTVSGSESGSNAIDLAADQRTLFYTSLGRNIYTVDVETGDVSVFATLPAATAGEQLRGIRVLPDGGIVVSDKVDIKRFNSSGTHIQTYSVDDQEDWGTLALSPDGLQLWAANTADSSVSPPMIVKFDLSLGVVLLTIDGDVVPDTAGFLCSGGITAWGGYRAASMTDGGSGGSASGVIGPLVWVHMTRRT